jgi:hypothetical protein
MSNFPTPELTPEENLRAENEMAALGLELKYGAHIGVSDEVPPEIMQQFLANISNFHRMEESSERITIYEKLGSPAFAPLDVLEPETLPGELKRLQKLLEDNGFAVFAPDDLPDAAFYEFIITEVFSCETPKETVPGMMTCLDYDEFHPSDEFEIGILTETFLLALLFLKESFPTEMLHPQCRNNDDIISREEASATIEQFRARFSQMVPVAFQLEEFVEKEHGTWQMFGICWEGTPRAGGPVERHEGLGIMQFKTENGEWRVQGVSMPGFEF